MSVNWNNKNIKKWLEKCRIAQEDYYKLLGRHEWIKYKPTEHDFLKSNIGFSLFNGPTETTGYTDKQRKVIDKMFQLIEATKEEHSDKENIWAAFLYVSCKIGDTDVEVPVIRVPKYDVKMEINSDIFIDSSLRVYENWQDCLDNNTLPDCLMCYPHGGKYFKLNNRLQLDKQVSPAGRIGSKVLKGFDITTTVIQVASAGVGVASLFVPVAWPLIVGVAGVNLATGGYTAGRSIAQLRDRDVHQQSIGLDNAESRNCYLGIVGSAMGIASGGIVAATARAAQAGESITMASQLAMKSITGASCAVNSLGVVNGIANIAQKVIKDEEVTSNDIFHVTSSILFFTNSVISVYQANMLLKSIPNDSNTNLLSKISELTKRSVGKIGEIVHFENIPNTAGLAFMSAVSTPAIQKSFVTACKDICAKLYELAQQFWQNVINLNTYKEQVGIYLKKLWDYWNEEINMVIEEICKRFGMKHMSPVVMGGCQYLCGQNPNFFKNVATQLITEQKKFQNSLQTISQDKNIKEDCQSGTSQTHSNKKLCQNHISQNYTKIDVEVAKEYRAAVLEISKKFADELQCENSDDFMRYMKFTCKFIRDEFIKQKQNYEKSLHMVRKFSHGVTVEDFDIEYGIQTHRNQYFLEQVIKSFKNGNGFYLLRFAYEKQKRLDLAEDANETCLLLSDDGKFKAIAIENQEGLAPDGWLNRGQYFEIAEKLTEEEANETNIALEEDEGNAVMIIRECEKIINVTTQKNDDFKVFGIALMLNN